MKTSLTKKIIFDFFDSKSTSIQQKMIAEWLQSPENEELFYQYLDEWESQHPQSEIDISEALKNVKSTIFAPSKGINARYQPFPKSFTKQLSFLLAAASLVVVCGWYVFSNITKQVNASYDSLVQKSKSETGEFYEKENRTNKVMLTNLPDGSSVLLKPKAKLSYSPNRFNRKTREVILSGDAFFEVKKDKNKPFIVHANNLITKVLGTSFTIKANAFNSKTEVFVKTGKVAVYTREEILQKQTLEKPELRGVVLEPNQQIVLKKGGFESIKPIKVNVQELTLPIQTLSFSFEDSPVIQVLEQLKMAYQVPIHYDKASLVNCKLTAHLSDEPLLEKIKLLCFALDATYTEEDGEISLKTKGCEKYQKVVGN